MNKKFDKILEGVMTRYQGGGVLPGDIVKFTDGADSSDWVKTQNATMAEKIAELMQSDNILRVGAVKTIRPTVAGGANTNNASDEFYADVVKELSPGLFTDVITVPVNLIVIQDNQHGVTAFPDSAVIDDPTDAEPKAPEVKAEDDTLHPPHQTATGDDERKLHNVNKDGGEAAPDHMTTKVYLGGIR